MYLSDVPTDRSIGPHKLKPICAGDVQHLSALAVTMNAAQYTCEMWGIYKMP